MRSRRTYLLGIFILLLILVSMYLMTRESPPTEGSPEKVALDYQLALIHEDYEVTLRTLSTNLSNLPRTADDLYRDLQDHNLLPEWDLDPCVYLESVEVHETTASVMLREQFYDSCTGVEVQNLTYDYIHMELRFVNGVWKIVDADAHFLPCWSNTSLCD